MFTVDPATYVRQCSGAVVGPSASVVADVLIVPATKRSNVAVESSWIDSGALALTLPST
jgi:hypothetical protein